MSCISQCNAIPVIVEIENDTLGLDYESVKKAIKLYNELGITTIDQLKTELQKNNSILHGKQKIGLNT